MGGEEGVDSDDEDSDDRGINGDESPKDVMAQRLESDPITNE